MAAFSCGYRQRITDSHVPQNRHRWIDRRVKLLEQRSRPMDVSADRFPTARHIWHANHCRRVWRGHPIRAGFAVDQDGFRHRRQKACTLVRAAEGLVFQKGHVIPSRIVFTIAKHVHFVSERTLGEWDYWNSGKRNLNGTDIRAVTYFLQINYNYLSRSRDLSRRYIKQRSATLRTAKAISVNCRKYILSLDTSRSKATMGSIRGKSNAAKASFFAEVMTARSP